MYLPFALVTCVGVFSSQMPSKSPFAAPLERMLRLIPLMEEQVAASEEVLADLLEKLSDMVSQTGACLNITLVQIMCMC